MKKMFYTVMAAMLIVCCCVGCGKTQTPAGTSDNDVSSNTVAREEVLSTIDSFVADVESHDAVACTKLLDPDMQALIESGNDSLGDTLGINKAFGFMNTYPTLTNATLFEDDSIEVKLDFKETISAKEENGKATYYIIYNVIMDGARFTTPIERECVVEFKLINKEKKWYIQGMREISQNADIEVLADGINIVWGTSFSDGVAFVQYKDDERYHAVAIDTTGKVLFELDDNFNLERISGYENGIMVVDNQVYDKTGKVIASPEINGYDELLTENCNGYVLAKKKEESFTGDKYYIGVINNKGEWEYPLSVDNPIVKEFEKEEADLDELYIDSSYHYISNTVLKIDIGFSEERYYNIATNELTNGYVYYESRNYQGQESGIYRYDLSGNRTLILKDIIGDIFFEDAFIGTAITWEDGSYSEVGYKIYDYNGNTITDLSQYKLVNCFSNNGPGEYYVNEHLLIPVDNGNGSEYLCLINKSGEPAFEPIKMEGRDDFYALDETGFVYRHVDENGLDNYKHYDFSGKTVEYLGVAYFDGFSEGLALVQNMAGQYYYINVNGEKVIK